MIANKCLVCGSSNFRADRALSGRLVCNSCGNPYGVRKKGRIKPNSFNPFFYRNKNWLFISIIIVAFILVII
tara:strand:+ start:668 stop:883 length:216 start_codon:yes stop_codon:yes gene_type:complete